MTTRPRHEAEITAFFSAFTLYLATYSNSEDFGPSTSKTWTGVGSLGEISSRDVAVNLDALVGKSSWIHGIRVLVSGVTTQL